MIFSYFPKNKKAALVDCPFHARYVTRMSKEGYTYCCRWNNLHFPIPSSANTAIMTIYLPFLLVLLLSVWQVEALPVLSIRGVRGWSRFQRRQMAWSSLLILVSWSEIIQLIHVRSKMTKQFWRRHPVSGWRLLWPWLKKEWVNECLNEWTDF